MARYVNGRDFRLYVLDAGEYKALSCLTDCQFSVTSDKIQITSRSTGVWSAYDYTGLSWSGSASGVFFLQPIAGGITPFELTDKQINRLKPQVRFVIDDPNGSSNQMSGFVVIDQMTYQGGVDDFAVFDLSFTGSGALTIENTAAPSVTSRVVNNDNPSVIIVTYDESLDTGSVPATSAFTASNRTVTGVSISGNQVLVTVNSPYAGGDSITLSYTAGANPVQDLSGNDAANYSNQTVTNNIASSIHVSTFTASNGTAATSYTPETGNAWTAVVGTLVITSNKATSSTFASNNALIQTFLADTTYTITALASKNATAGQKGRIMFRVVDTNNYMALDWYDNTVTLGQTVSGSFSAVGSWNPSPSINNTSEHQFVITVGSSSVSLTIDGNSVFSGQSIPAQLNTGQYMWIGQDGGTAACVEFNSITVNP